MSDREPAINAESSGREVVVDAEATGQELAGKVEVSGRGLAVSDELSSRELAVSDEVSGRELAVNYDGRRFRPVSEDPEEAGRSALYRQQGDLLWGEFSGGDTRRGVLNGICRPDGTLEFAYSMVKADGQVVIGRCQSEPTTLPDGRIRLYEVWERYGAHAASGVSYLEEVPFPRQRTGDAGPPGSDA
ncbi:hypothetical protein [Kitasatospora acidiphila]|uniref:hypothetical protein n=1 Tax=Kitasatospora acidiphila TaxID=2567942 RepID=UPI001E5FF945|nr:hypothetical protein [Kitasatospora acidiphila]